MPSLDDISVGDDRFPTKTQRMLRLSRLDTAIATNIGGRCPAQRCKRRLPDDSVQEERYGVSLWHCGKPRCGAEVTKILEFLPSGPPDT
jgi:hypothetical protein